MNRIRILTVLVFALLALLPRALGQDQGGVIEPLDADMVNPAARISFPPPVYVVRDRVDIRGSVTLENLQRHFIEIRPLVVDPMETEEDEQKRLWFAATEPRIESVNDDVLGTWNTVTMRDGLYELRLQIVTDDGVEFVRVSPIRVEKTPPPFVSAPAVEPAAVAPAVEPDAVAPAEEPAAAEPTPIPEPTDTPDPTPRVVANVDSNVRRGDSTQYPIIGALLTGETAKVRGISSRNTGWYYIELANGRTGFIFPGIVTAEGSLSNLPRINPPLLPPTPIPPPTAVPVQPPPQQPASNGANLKIEQAKVAPHPPKCNQAYKIDVLVRNIGTAASASGGMIEVRDSRPDGAGMTTTRIAFGPLQPNQAQWVFGHLTQASYYNELHHINLHLDVDNQVAETNEGDNHHAEAPYILDRAGC